MTEHAGVGGGRVVHIWIWCLALWDISYNRGSSSSSLILNWPPVILIRSQSVGKVLKSCIWICQFRATVVTLWFWPEWKFKKVDALLLDQCNRANKNIMTLVGLTLVVGSCTRLRPTKALQTWSTGAPHNTWWHCIWHGTNILKRSYYRSNSEESNGQQNSAKQRSFVH